MPQKPSSTGFQPRNTPAERRAFFDQRRQTLADIAASGGGGGGTPGSGYVHNQSTPSAVWTINHTLGFIPNVSVVDSAGDQVEGEIRYVDADTVRLTFTSPFSGIAYLS